MIFRKLWNWIEALSLFPFRSVKWIWLLVALWSHRTLTRNRTELSSAECRHVRIAVCSSGFHQSVQVDFGVVPWIRSPRFLLNPYSHPTNWGTVVPWIKPPRFLLNPYSHPTNWGTGNVPYWRKITLNTYWKRMFVLVICFPCIPCIRMLLM
jgi:hypothetical protein